MYLFSNRNDKIFIETYQFDYLGNVSEFSFDDSCLLFDEISTIYKSVIFNFIHVS